MAATIAVTRADAPGIRSINVSPPAAPTAAAPTAAAPPRIDLDFAPPPQPRAPAPAAPAAPAAAQPPPGRVMIRRPPPLHKSSPPPPQIDMRALNTSYNAFSRGKDDDDDDDEDEDDFGEDGDDFGGNGNDFGGNGYNDDDGEDHAAPDDDEPPLVPGDGFASLDDEKSDIIVRLARLAKRGFKSSRSFTMMSDLREMRVELLRLQTEADLEASIRFQRRALVAVSSGIEFANKRYGRGYAHLDGWSESVHDECASSSWDGIFERLFLKYRTKSGSLPPELELIVGLVGSAGMFHWSQAMSTAAIPEMSRVMRENPQLMQQIMTTMASASAGPQGAAAAGGPQPPSGRPEMAPPPPPPPQQQFGNLGNLFGNLPSVPVPAMMPMLNSRRAPPPSRPAASVVELRENDDDDQSEHLSDVISEELESLSASSSEDGDVRVIPMARKKPADAAPKKKILRI